MLLTDQPYRSEFPTTFSLGSINLLQGFRELRETFYLLDNPFITKDITQEQSGGRDV